MQCNAVCLSVQGGVSKKQVKRSGGTADCKPRNLGSTWVREHLVSTKGTANAHRRVGTGESLPDPHIPVARDLDRVGGVGWGSPWRRWTSQTRPSLVTPRLGPELLQAHVAGVAVAVDDRPRLRCDWN